MRAHLRRRKSHPLRRAPHNMPRTHTNQRRESRRRNRRMQRKSMANIRQVDQRTIPMRIQRQQPGRPHMKPRKRHKRISQCTRAAQRGPRNRAAVASCFGAIAAQGLAAAVEAESDARGDMCDEREGDESGFSEEGLVVWTCEEEVAVGLGDGACEERQERGVCYVEGCEDCKGVGGVSLGACYCTVILALCASCMLTRTIMWNARLGFWEMETYTTKQPHGPPTSTPAFPSSSPRPPQAPIPRPASAKGNSSFRRRTRSVFVRRARDRLR
jgi:hypothetical protein